MLKLFYGCRQKLSFEFLEFLSFRTGRYQEDKRLEIQATFPANAEILLHFPWCNLIR